MRVPCGDVCACVVVVGLLLGLTEAQKNLAHPVDSQRNVLGSNPAVTTSATVAGKRYGSSTRNDVRRYNGAAPSARNGYINGNGMQVHDGHRMITRALWRIFDALMQKKDHSQLYGRVGFVEEALKKMISVDTQLEDEIDKLKDDAAACRSHLGTVMEELGRLKALTSRVEAQALEGTRPELLLEQGDQQAGVATEWAAAAAYSSCPPPFQLVRGECFLLLTDEKLGWEDGRRACSRLGGDLSSPRHLEALREFLADNEDAPEYLWVGGSKAADGTWVWSSGPQTGVPLDMSKDTWNEEVPSGSGKCLGLFRQSSYRAYNYDCKEKDFLVCQYFF